MKREILFRGFHESENGKETIYINGKEIKGFWVYGYYELFNDTAHINYESDRLNSGGYKIREFVEVIPETIGQYTGLTDKNGKKIFERDIVNFKTTAYHFKNCRIKYQSCHARYCAIDNKGYEYPMDKTFEYEIIGNILSNPELLEVNE